MPPRSPNTNDQKPEHLLLGEVLRPHGIQGELRMRVLTDYPERIAELDYVYLGKSPNAPAVERYAVQHIRMNQEYVLLKLKGVDDRNQADLLRGFLVMVKFEDAVPLEEDEVYLFELIGLDVRTEEGQPLGKLRDVLETGANDVYIIDSPQHGEVLIPVIPGVVLETNVEEGFMVVKLPEGLLPE